MRGSEEKEAKGRKQRRREESKGEWKKWMKRGKKKGDKEKVLFDKLELHNATVVKIFQRMLAVF